MKLFDWLKRIKTVLLARIDTRIGRRLLYFSFAISFMFLGGILYALIYEEIDSPYKRLGYYFSLITGPVAVILLIIDRVFSIENKERDLQLKEVELGVRESSFSSAGLAAVNEVASLVTSRLRSNDSVYEAREKHYRKEKECLAKHVCDLLCDRIEYLNARGIKKIRIFFDSGTTIAPILNEMGFRSEIDQNYWPKTVDIITNNVRGINYLLKYRKKKALSPKELDDRYIEIPFECNVLPGKILSAFQAIVDESTFTALGFLRKYRADYYTISVTTGNYVLLDTWHRNFLPIARAKLHPHFKAGLYFVSDEVYVVAPLGKLLKNEFQDDNDSITNMEQLLSSFNEDLKYSKSAQVASKKNYTLVKPDLITNLFPSQEPESVSLDSWFNKSVLVITEREKGRHLFAPHFESIKRCFRDFKPKDDDFLEDDTHRYVSTCRFDDIDVWENQIEIEIPHENLRPFMNKYFSTEAK